MVVKLLNDNAFKLLKQCEHTRFNAGVVFDLPSGILLTFDREFRELQRLIDKLVFLSLFSLCL